MSVLRAASESHRFCPSRWLFSARPSTCINYSIYTDLSIIFFLCSHRKNSKYKFICCCCWLPNYCIDYVTKKLKKEFSLMPHLMHFIQKWQGSANRAASKLLPMSQPTPCDARLGGQTPTAQQRLGNRADTEESGSTHHLNHWVDQWSKQTSPLSSDFSRTRTSHSVTC